MAADQGFHIARRDVYCGKFGGVEMFEIAETCFDKSQFWRRFCSRFFVWELSLFDRRGISIFASKNNRIPWWNKAFSNPCDFDVLAQ